MSNRTLRAHTSRPNRPALSSWTVKGTDGIFPHGPVEVFEDAQPGVQSDEVDS